MTPEISIIIPCFNRPDKLERTLSNIKKACSISHEILLIDDSLDGCNFEAAKKYNTRYFYKAGMDKGQAKSRNIAIKFAKGKYIYFLDDDDIVHANCIDILYSHMDKKTTFVYGNYCGMHDTMLTDDAEKIKNIMREKIQNDSSNITNSDQFDLSSDGKLILSMKKLKSITRDDMFVVNTIPVGCFLIAKSLIKYMFDESMRGHEDWDFLLSNVDWNESKYIDEHILTIDRTQTTSFSKDRDAKGVKNWMDFFYIYIKHPEPTLYDKRMAKFAQLGISLQGNMTLDNS